MKRYYITAGLIIAIDQLTKFFASQMTAKVQVFGPFYLNFVTNTGAGFSILQGQNVMLAIVNLAITAGLIYYFKRFKKEERIYVAMIIGGAVGNLIDRLVHGHVIDFVDLSYWPVFNVADSAVFIGVMMLLVISFKRP